MYIIIFNANKYDKLRFTDKYYNFYTCSIVLNFFCNHLDLFIVKIN